MRNIWLVVKHDVGVTLRQRSFWLLAVLMPILLVGFQAFALVGRGPANTGGAGLEKEDTAAAAKPAAVGLVDPAGFLARLPAGLPPDLFVPYSDDAAARAALDAGQIKEFVSVPGDYLASGQVTVYARNFRLMNTANGSGPSFSSAEGMLEYVINYNLAGDEALVAALRNPTPANLAEWHILNPPPAADASNQELAELMSSIVPYAFYFLLLMGSSYLMRSVVAEKENRTAEVLLLSLDPRQLMVGKILAMSLVLLLQIAIWVGGGALALNRGADLLNLARFRFPPGFVVWAALFLVLGYLLYASIMAAAGAVAKNNREGGQVTWLLVIPLMPTLMFGPLLIDSPRNPLVLFLSLFPFSSPAAMVTRLAVHSVPLWQLLTSLALLAGTTYLMVLLAARFFRAGNLVSEEAFNWLRFARGWGKASRGD